VLTEDDCFAFHPTLPPVLRRHCLRGVRGFHCPRRFPAPHTATHLNLHDLPDIHQGERAPPDFAGDYGRRVTVALTRGALLMALPDGSSPQLPETPPYDPEDLLFRPWPAFT
jgi:hypothetical protein